MHISMNSFEKLKYHAIIMVSYKYINGQRYIITDALGFFGNEKKLNFIFAASIDKKYQY